MSENFYQYQATTCKRIDSEYYCPKGLLIDGYLENDCLFQILKLNGAESTCIQFPVIITDTIIEQITESYYIGVFPNKTKIQTSCAETDFTVLQGTYLINLPPGCSFRTPEYVYINEMNSIKGQPFILPEIQTTKITVNLTKKLKVDDIPLDKLHTLKKMQDAIEPISLQKEDNVLVHFWTAPLYIILFLSVSAYMLYRFKKLKCRQPIRSTQSSTNEGQPHVDEPVRSSHKVLFVPDNTLT
ncbi:hypothetical protein NQ317_018812 [Molorchus minor]|uniref:Uncharacterized protein n=1 Tax=Molorchus minor TaxID=1323400 RepID=A0ABQ9JT21_9CUCU|nr:hypothetical protein NQ317_018812 [Molorchus minor]